MKPFQPKKPRYSLINQALSLAVCALSMAAASASGAVIYHDFEAGITNTLDTPLTVDLATGIVGGISNNTTITLAASNAGANLQFQINTGGGGPVVSSAAPYLLLKKYEEGDTISGSIQEDTSGFPGFSTNGIGKYRIFGSGEFSSGEIGYLGFRFGDGDSGFNYGWAEVTGIDGTSITLLRAAYDDSGAAIDVGTTSAVPEASTSLGLLALGVGGLLTRRRFKRAA